MPTLGTMLGEGGGVLPLQYRLSRPPAPQISAELPAHGMLQSLDGALVDPAPIEFPQSSIAYQEKIATKMEKRREDCNVESQWSLGEEKVRGTDSIRPNGRRARNRRSQRLDYG